MITTKTGQEDYWIERLKDGDNTALAHFFELHSRPLTYFAGRLLGDGAEAEDVVSKCFLKVWEKRGSFKTPQNIKAFLYISCRNACLDYLDSLKVRTQAQERYRTHLESAGDTALYDVIQSEVLDLVNQEIEELPEKMRVVFKMLYVDDKSTAEIAEELGLSVQTVRNQKTKAIELIRNALARKGVSSALQLAFLLFVDGK